MNATQNNVASTRAPFPLPQPISQAIVSGLHGLVDIDGGPTPEQTSILNALATHILGIDMRTIANAAAITPYELGMRLQDARYQRIFSVRGAMDVPGAADLFAEALQRGAAGSGDFTKLDHLAIAHMPLIEIRRELKIPPLSKSMYDDKEFWPSSC